MQTCPDPADPSNGTIQMVDLYEQSANGTVSRPAHTLNNSQTCSQLDQHGDGETPPCDFEDDVFLHRVKSVIVTHASTAPATQPMFLYWAAHACHGPREVSTPTSFARVSTRTNTHTHTHTHTHARARKYIQAVICTTNTLMRCF
jgi:hypothetical protein